MQDLDLRTEPYSKGLVNELTHYAWLLFHVHPQARQTVNHFFQGEKVRIWLDRQLMKKLRSFEIEEHLQDERDEAIRQIYEQIGRVVTNQIVLENELRELNCNTPELIRRLTGMACFSVEAGQVSTKSAERWIAGIKCNSAS